VYRERGLRQGAEGGLSSWLVDFAMPGRYFPERLKNLVPLPIRSPAMSNSAETSFRRVQIPLAPDRRRQDRVVTSLPMRIVSVDGNPVFYPAICTNLRRGGIGFDVTERLYVGKVIEFEFVHVIDEAVRYWVKILFRNENRYGGYYVNDDGTDIRQAN
jgi:hypothetical protein